MVGRYTFGQDPRGRKYKAPPETAHIVVQITKATNGKPVVNAAVVFHPIKDGKDEGNLEVKTDPDGKTSYELSDQKTPEKFAAAKVTVTGTLDPSTKVIKVDKISAAK